MNLEQFYNGLRVLTSIDRHELEAAGVVDVPKGQGVYPGCMDEPNKTWERFRSDPFRFFIRCDDDKARKIWSIVEKRAELAESKLKVIAAEASSYFNAAHTAKQDAAVVKYAPPSVRDG